MNGIFDLVKRYPWLPSLKKCYPEKGSSNPIDFINGIFLPDNKDDIKERILEFFKGAFNRIEDFSFYMNEELNIDFYLVIRIFLSILNDKQITNRIAELYSKIAKKSLNDEINNEFNLYYIYKDLNLDVRYHEEPQIYKEIRIKDQISMIKTKFQIYFIDYLNLATKLRDDYRRLVNNSLSNGYVFIQTKDLNRLIQEYVRLKIITLIDLNGIKDKLFENQVLKELIENIRETWRELKEDLGYFLEFEYSKDKNLRVDFPPCIQEIFAKVKEGKNLIHTERLFIVWFLIALKFPEEEIVNIFSVLPDFDRDKTGYQVRYAIRKNYTPYSCKSLKSYDLCMAKKYKDKICLEGYYSKTQGMEKELSRPLSYIKIKQYRSKNQPQTQNE